MKNTAASIRARLSKLAKTEKINTQLIYIRYFHERLLYRISVSKYFKNFILKGGGLLYYYNHLKARPTLDIDLLGNHINSEIESILVVFIEICALSFPEDGVIFKTNTLTATQIQEQASYKGIRLHIECGLEKIQQRIQIDIGFGDVVTPEPVVIDYPTLLPELKNPKLCAYTKETVIAEKFQTMIEFSGLNSRMKDFFDIYCLLKNEKINQNDLESAIRHTFKNRNTKYNAKHNLFSGHFIDAEKLRQWNAFLKKADLPDNLEFEEVLKLLTEKLRPIWKKI